MVRYLPYVLMFAFATMVIYGWGIRRSMKRNRDLSNMLIAKGIGRIKRALRKNGTMTKKELKEVVKSLSAKQPFSRESMGVTDADAFLESLLPYMIRQKIIVEDRKNHQKAYRLNKIKFKMHLIF